MPRNATISEIRSSDESRNPPNRVTLPESRATLPSSISNRLAMIRTIPAQKNSPKPKSTQQPTFIVTPIVVKMFGLTPLNANHLTSALMIRIAPRPMLAPNIFLVLCPLSFVLCFFLICNFLNRRRTKDKGRRATSVVRELSSNF